MHSKWAAAVMAAMAWSSVARAEDCKAISDPTERLACFDKSTAPPIVSPQLQTQTFKVVDTSDLVVGTKKYIGKNIELQKLKCYYANVDDYRCVTPGFGPPFALFTAKVEPASAKKWIEDKCDKVKIALTSNACNFNARFSFTETEVETDVISGMQERTVIRPAAGVVMVSKSEKDTRR